MKIGLITTAMDEKKAGIGWYCHNLIENLSKIDKENEYVLIHRKKSDDPLYKKFNEVIIPYPKILMKKTIGDNVQIAFALKKLYKRTNFDLVHETAHSAFFMFDLPFKKVMTIHDLTPVLFPETFDKFTAFVHRFLIPRALKKADVVITVSENTKRDIIRFYKVPEDKIEVIYNGIDHNNFKRFDKNFSLNYLKKKYKINFKFILSVGTVEPRKNYINLIRAFHYLKKNNMIDYKLIIIGKKGWKYDNIYRLVKNLDLRDDIIFIGYVPYRDLPIFYNCADVFIYPSFYEGFGLPVLEAMACGCPVVASSTSSIPEILEDCGLRINPYNFKEIADKILILIKDESLKKELSVKGLRRAKKFDWTKTAEKTLSVYKSLCEDI